MRQHANHPRTTARQTRPDIPACTLQKVPGRLLVLLTLLLICAAGTTLQGKRKEKRSIVLIETTAGNIRVALSDDTPLHRDNFLMLVKEKYYDGTLFHRVIENFMIQGGDPDSRGAAPGKVLGNGDQATPSPPSLTYPSSTTGGAPWLLHETATR